MSAFSREICLVLICLCATVRSLQPFKLSFESNVCCSYDYQVAIHTARGSKSTETNGMQLSAKVDVTPVSRDTTDGQTLNLVKLDVYEPRLRRARGSLVLITYPVNHDLEKKLSRPFYFRQNEHGSVADVMFPKSDSPEIVAFKKGIAGAFQLSLRNVYKQNGYEERENDDSGVYSAKYTVFHHNNTHLKLQKQWTNYDYQQFADGTPISGEHKLHLKNEVNIHLENGRVKNVHRKHHSSFRAKDHPRAENFKDFKQNRQDIEMTTKGYSVLTLKSCNMPNHHRMRREVQDDNLHTVRNLFRVDTLLFKDFNEINWNEIGGQKKKTRPLETLLRCFNDKSLKEHEQADCVVELHNLVRSDTLSFKIVRNMLHNREHQNLTTWSALLSAVVAQGKIEAQETLSYAMKATHLRPLTVKEYEALLEAMLYLPSGPIHRCLFEALLNAAQHKKLPETLSSLSMLALSGMTERSQRAGYNTSLAETVVSFIHDSFRNKSINYHPDSEEHESYIRRHVWAYGNLGHVSGLDNIIQYINHDNSHIRSAVVSAMARMPSRHTNHHLYQALYKDETKEVKTAVVEVFKDRHEQLTKPMVEALEYALSIGDKGDALDGTIKEFLENHGNHQEAVRLRKKRKYLHRRKRALFPALRPRQFTVGINKPWSRGFGGEWLGAEALLQLVDELRLRIGIFGGSFKAVLENSVKIRAHLLKFKFVIVEGKAAFKAYASFKNDIPKDLTEIFADIDENILSRVDSVLNVVTKGVENVRNKIWNILPLKFKGISNFLQKLVAFISKFSAPLKPVEKINQVLKSTKKVLVGVVGWQNNLRSIQNLKSLLKKMSLPNDPFKNELTLLNNMLEIVDRISLKLPHDLPVAFRIEDLQKAMRETRINNHWDKIREYFSAIGSTMPTQFPKQFPLNYVIRSPSLVFEFSQMVKSLLKFGNKVLDFKSLLDAATNLRLPELTLLQTELGQASQSSQKASYSSALKFDWKIGINVDLDLFSLNVLKIEELLSKGEETLKQMDNPNFNLQSFFDKIKRGKRFEHNVWFSDIFGNNTTVLTPNFAFDTNFVLRNLESLYSKWLPQLRIISNISVFFQELGASMQTFAKENINNLCHIHQFASNSSQDLKDFEKMLQESGVNILKKIDESVDETLSEMENHTRTVDHMMSEISEKFSLASTTFVANSFNQLNTNLKSVQDVIDGVVGLANGSSNKAQGLCAKTVDLSASIIDEVQGNAREAVQGMTSFIGPLSDDIRRLANNLKTSINTADAWYKINMKENVGKLSRVAQIISDFLAMVNTNKGFIGTVKNTARAIDNAIMQLRKVPEYTVKARQTVDDMIKFADTATDTRAQLLHLDVRQNFGVDFAKKVQDACTKFSKISVQAVRQLSSISVIQEVNGFFTDEAERFVRNAARDLNLAKKPLKIMRKELLDMSRTISHVMKVLLELKPINNVFSPILKTISNLPNCSDLQQVIVESIKPCVKAAYQVDKDVIDNVLSLKEETAALVQMVPATFKNFKSQKCVRGGTCIEKTFIKQAKVVKTKIALLKSTIESAKTLSSKLKSCKRGAEDIGAVVNTVKHLVEQAKTFSYQNDILESTELISKLTGRLVKATKHVEIRSLKDFTVQVKKITDFFHKGKSMKNKFDNLLSTSFKTFRSVHSNVFQRHVKSFLHLRKSIESSQQIWKEVEQIQDVIGPLDSFMSEAIAYSHSLRGISDSLSGPVANLLTETTDISKVAKPLLTIHISTVPHVVKTINDFYSKVSTFLESIQIRQRGLNPEDYKPWDQVPQCSKDVCLRLLRRSSSLYLNTIFVWKYPHLDDLSSTTQQNAGRWLIPGLFDYYKPQGITQLSRTEMLLGYHGVVSNTKKASVLVLINLPDGKIKKIIQLFKDNFPFSINLGGIATARNFIWISDSESARVYQISKSAIINSLSSSAPTDVTITSSFDSDGNQATSLSYDEKDNTLWVTDGSTKRAYGYKLAVNGDITRRGSAPRILDINKHARGLAIVRQFGSEYACVSRCAMAAGSPCRLEFHNLNNGDDISKNKPSRVVRTPCGLESVQQIGEEDIAVVFSGAAMSEKAKVELKGGDFEDRFFRLKLPILKTDIGIYENCLYFKIAGKNLFEPRSVFPVDHIRCGTRRKRSLERQILDSDVYSKKLEDFHKTFSRKRRSNSEENKCSANFRINLKRGHHQFFHVEASIPVYGIAIRLFAGASGTYIVDLKGSFCPQVRKLQVGLIPGAWISCYAGAAVSLLIIEAGVTIEAKILGTYFLPQLTLIAEKFPMDACAELKIRMMPLSITVSLWVRFRFCIKFKAWLFGISIEIRWCRRINLWQWTWSMKAITFTLFNKCSKQADKTPPIAGTCLAKQIAEKQYLVQWHGFKEDTKIYYYRVRIGSIPASGDDFSTFAGTALTTVAKGVEVMDERRVYVSVIAGNDEGLESQPAICPVFQAKRRSPEIAFVYDGVDVGKDIDYQSNNFTLGMNFEMTSGREDLVSVSWGISTSQYCTLTVDELDVVPLTPLGDSNSAQTSGLDLEHTKMYYTRVVAVNSVGMKSVRCSDGVTIDITPPLPRHAQDGSKVYDANYILSVRRARAKFEDFHDPESPMIRYEVKITTNKTNLDITQFVPIPLYQKNPMIGGLSLTPGKAYKMVIRGTNAAKLQSTTRTNGFVPDISLPICDGGITDVTDKSDENDVDFVKDLIFIRAKWSCKDSESRIESHKAAVGTYPGGANIIPFADVKLLNVTTARDGKFYLQFPNITIDPKSRYHVTVIVKNKAGLQRTITSDGIMVDNSPPTVAAQFIKDGIAGGDMNYSKEQLTYSAHWEQAFTDSESGIQNYKIGLGTQPGALDVQQLRSIGRKTDTTLTELLLNSGQKYYATIVGCNGVGMCVNGSSNGVLVDFVAPHAGHVITGYQGPPVLYQWTQSVWARWDWCPADQERKAEQLDLNSCDNSSFYDVHSGITEFGISVTSATEDKELFPFKLVGKVTQTGRNVEMNDGVYSVVMQAKDKSGTTTRALSDTFIKDSTPPKLLQVKHGLQGEELLYVNVTKITFSAYFEMVDDLSEVVLYKVGVGSFPGKDDIIQFTTHAMEESKAFVKSNWSADGVYNLRHSRQYFITVRATNNAGLFSIKSSTPLTVDTEPPKGAIVQDGWGLLDDTYQVYSSIYRVHWQGLTDLTGIETVLVCLSSKYMSCLCDVKPFQKTVKGSNHHLFSELNLKPGQTYYACVNAIDRAGNEALFWSNGVTIDPTPPISGYVRDGRPPNEIDVQSEISVLRCWWGNFSDMETKITFYQLAFGTSPGSNDIQDLTSVGLVFTAASSKLKVSKLTSGIRYYATVVAFNSLGISSRKTSSNGVLIDSSPPVFTEPVFDGNVHGRDAKYTSLHVLTATWRCVDLQSGIERIEIAFGLQPGAQEIVNFTVVNTNTMSYTSAAVLRLGYRYFATVRCTNKAGLKSLLSSDGIIYDSTPPKGIHLNDGFYQSSLSSIKINWKFVDPESDVVRYDILLHESENPAATIQGPYTFGSNVSALIIQLDKSLVNGKKYLVSVTATNNAGHSATLISDGFTVDTSPPVCLKVWAGKGAGTNVLKFASSIIKPTIVWDCFDKETPIVSYQFSVKNVISNTVVIPFHKLDQRQNSSGSAIITGNGVWKPKYQHSSSYAVAIKLTNFVNKSSIYWTDSIQIDNSPPQFSSLRLAFDSSSESLVCSWQVQDPESGLQNIEWGLGFSPDSTEVKNFTKVSTDTNKMIVSNVSLKSGKTYFLSLKAVNMAGLSSRTASSGIIIDRTLPSAGFITANYLFPNNYDRSNNFVKGASFVVFWTGFVDFESGIAKFSWIVGSDSRLLKHKDNSHYQDVVSEKSLRGTIILNQTLYGNVTYCVCIRATNRVGLSRTNCSQGMTVRLGIFTTGIVEDGPYGIGKDIDFQLDDKSIWAHWSGFKDPTFGVVRYDWCIGDTQPDSLNSVVCKWDFTTIPHLERSAHRFYNISLTQGVTYYVTVRAYNIRRESVLSTSDGVTVDRTPPIAKHVHISPVLGTETLYITAMAAPVVTWVMDDPESGIKYFEVCVGTFTLGSDIIDYFRVSAQERSLDLEDTNMTLTEAMKFYVTVTAVNMLGLRTSITSSQVVVDWTPPEIGTVFDGNKTRQCHETKPCYIDADYQNDVEMLSAHWLGFGDKESDIKEYHWCFGTTQGLCDIHNMTSCGLSTDIQLKLILDEGTRYYVTIQATNGAGLSDMAYSDGITVDNTPPIVGLVRFVPGGYPNVFENIQDQITAIRSKNSEIVQRNKHEFSFTWDEISDAQSGIVSLSWCAGSKSSLCDLIQMKEIKIRLNHFTYSLYQPLTSGTHLFVTLTAKNGAGLTSMTTSDSLLIDSSPPVPGDVTIVGVNETKYLQEGNPLTVRWHRFIENESKLTKYEWAICHLSNVLNCITPLISVRTLTGFSNDALNLKPATAYVVKIVAHNSVGLSSTAFSNMFIVNNNNPDPGFVYDGKQVGNDINWQSTTNEVSATWEPFSDANDRIIFYEMCAGTEPEECDVSEYVIVGLNLRGTISGLSLRHMETYYVAVRATNGAGYIVTSVSNGVRVDTTSPVGGRVWLGETREILTFQAQDSFVSANWDPFEDPESEVTKYIWCAGTTERACDVIPETNVGDSKTAGQQIYPSLGSGLTVYVTLKVYNDAGAATVVSSHGVTVDTLPPRIQQVRELSDVDGLHDVDYITSKDSLCISWDSSDPESGIARSTVAVCKTVDPLDCVQPFIDVGNQSFICLPSLEIEEGIKYTTHLTSTNGAGLSTLGFSDGFMLDSSPPYIGEIKHVENPAVNFDSSFKHFANSGLIVNFEGFWDKESGLQRFLACAGIKPEACDVFHVISVVNSTRFNIDNIPLSHGTEYFVSGSAVNEAGLRSNMTSSVGVYIDHTGPVGGIVFDGNVIGDDIDVQRNCNEISAHWTPFDDPESDVIKIAWCLGSTYSLCDILSKTEVEPGTTTVNHFLEYPLGSGKRVYFTVEATNGAGITTTRTSDGVTIDVHPPSIGIVIDGEREDVDYLNGDDDVKAHWFGFSDEESGVQLYEIALCDSRNTSDCPQPFVSVQLSTNFSITGLDLQAGRTYTVKVRATDFAGNKADAMSDGFTVDFSPPLPNIVWDGTGPRDLEFYANATFVAFSWLPFEDEESGIVAYHVCFGLQPGNCSEMAMQNVGIKNEHQFGGVELGHGTEIYGTVRATNGAGLYSEASSNGILVDLTPPQLQTLPNNPASANGSRDLLTLSKSKAVPEALESIVFNVSTRSEVKFLCTKETLLISWDKMEDTESGLLKYSWCVGTKPGKCNLVDQNDSGLKTFVEAFYSKIPINVAMFSTIWAVNTAGLKTILTSNPCQVSHLAPMINDVRLLNSLSTSAALAIHWQGTRESLDLSWKLASNTSSLSRVQIAVTTPYDNRSTPSLLSSSWNGETVVQNFVDVLPRQQRVSLRSVTLEPWRWYRCIVRVTSKDGLYTERASDGIRIETSAPPKRKVSFNDQAALREPVRWLPGIKIPLINQIESDADITYISSPTNITVDVRAIKRLNASTVDWEGTPAKAFEVYVTRLISDKNNSNTEEQTKFMKKLQGISDPEGACCREIPTDPPVMFADVHMKTVLPARNFGTLVGLLSSNHLVVAADGMVTATSLSDITQPASILNVSEGMNGMATFGSRLAVLTNNSWSIFKLVPEKSSHNLSLKRIGVIGTCIKTAPRMLKQMSLAAIDCEPDNTWADSISHLTAFHGNIMAVVGQIRDAKQTRVALFQEDGKYFKLDQFIDKDKTPLEQIDSLSLNGRHLAIASHTKGKHATVIKIYSRSEHGNWTESMQINIGRNKHLDPPINIQLMENNFLIMLSTSVKILVVVKLNVAKETFEIICFFPFSVGTRVSGSFDIEQIENRTVIAVGIKTIKNINGVQLIGFRSSGLSSPRTSWPANYCPNLGVVYTRDVHEKYDVDLAQAPVVLRGGRLFFGTPSAEIWPAIQESEGTGRVYVAHYCPPNYVRTRTFSLGALDGFKCTPCENGSKSFGGFSSTCTRCKDQICGSIEEGSMNNVPLCDRDTCDWRYSQDKNRRVQDDNISSDEFFVPAPHYLYTITLVETSRAGLSTVSKSKSFIIDYTPPEQGIVYDGLGSDSQQNCSANMTFGENSQCSTRNFADTDIDYTFNTTEISARWIDFRDNESDIVEYFWCVGSQPMKDNIRACESTGLRMNGSHSGMNLYHGDSYYVTVLACNAAGRCTAGHSNGVSIDTTPPIMSYVRDGVMGADMDFQVFLDIMFAYYSASDPESGVTSYEAAWGTRPGLTDVKEFEEVGNTTVWFAKSRDNALESGTTYYATVRSTNAAGLLSEPLSSDGITVGKTEFLFDNKTTGSFFFDTVNINPDGTREDKGVGTTYGTLNVPEGAINEEVKLRCYRVDEKALATNRTEDGPVSNPKYTKPKHFMLGNYSFQIKALDPVNNAIKEGYHFAKPIVINMFYDVDSLVESNAEVVSNEVTTEDVNPILFLWDPKNETWFDATLTCPEPWINVNRTMKLLSVKVCHLTQYAFFWTFKAQYGIVEFNKNRSVFNADGKVIIPPKSDGRPLNIQLALPVQRRKGAIGDIVVTWSVVTNYPAYTSKTILPSAGELRIPEGQWNSDIVLEVNQDDESSEDRVFYVKLRNTTGGAILASPPMTETEVIIKAGIRSSNYLWKIGGAVAAVLFLIVAIAWTARRLRNQKKRRMIDVTKTPSNSVGMTELRRSKSTEDGDVKDPNAVASQE